MGRWADLYPEDALYSLPLGQGEAALVDLDKWQSRTARLPYPNPLAWGSIDGHSQTAAPHSRLSP
jgi:hypothetical protein